MKLTNKGREREKGLSVKGKKAIQANQEEKEQISNGQFALLLAAFLLGGQQIFSPVEPTLLHNQWLSTLGAAVLGFFLLGLYLRIGKLFPGKNFSQILTTVFGRFFGKILSVIYGMQFLFSTGFSLLLMSNFWIDLDMWYTPQIIIMFLVMAVAAFGFYSGVESLARAAGIVVFLLLVIAFLDTVFLIPVMNGSYLLPWGELDPAVWGKSVKYILFLEYFNLLMLVIPGAHTPVNRPGQKSVKPWILLVFLYLIVIDIRSALVLGPATYLYDYPTTQVLKVIDLVGVVPQIELMGIMVLIASGLLRIAYMFYVALEMVNDTFAMRKKRLLIVPFALFVLAVAFCFVGFSQGIEKQLDFYFSWVGVPLYLIIPFLLAAAGIYQKHKRKKQSPE